MIAKDQPTTFERAVTVAVSSANDGNLKFGVTSDENVETNRRLFLKANEISIDQATSLSIDYDRSDYAAYREVQPNEKGDGMCLPKNLTTADGLVVTSPDHALFLPLADCCGVVLYDIAKRALMLSHIGRHSAEVDGAARSVAFLQKNYDSDPVDIQAWLSPAVGRATYPVRKMGGRGLQELIVEQLQSAGVQPENIEVSAVDTATDLNYFSHSQFLAGNQATDGRFAVVAMMNAQGEPAV